MPARGRCALAFRLCGRQRRRGPSTAAWLRWTASALWRSCELGTLRAYCVSGAPDVCRLIRPSTAAPCTVSPHPPRAAGCWHSTLSLWLACPAPTWLRSPTPLTPRPPAASWWVLGWGAWVGWKKRPHALGASSRPASHAPPCRTHDRPPAAPLAGTAAAERRHGGGPVLRAVRIPHRPHVPAGGGAHRHLQARRRSAGGRLAGRRRRVRGCSPPSGPALHGLRTLAPPLPACP